MLYNISPQLSLNNFKFYLPQEEKYEITFDAVVESKFNSTHINLAGTCIKCKCKLNLGRPIKPIRPITELSDHIMQGR